LFVAHKFTSFATNFAFHRSISFVSTLIANVLDVHTGIVTSVSWNVSEVDAPAETKSYIVPAFVSYNSTFSSNVETLTGPVD
jgi:hypothetical protein